METLNTPAMQARQEFNDDGRLDLKRLGELLIEADKLPINEHAGTISATGTLEIAARALGEAPIAGSIRSMAKHLGMLRRAVEENDVGTVAALFQVYRFD